MNSLKRLKIFICHSDKNKIIAGKFKRVFERYFGFDVFLAHDDIELEEEWNPEIIDKLRKCHIFIPLVSKQLGHSQFANQEIGLAIGWQKKIISIKIDGSDKFGFLSIYQACPHKELGGNIEKRVSIDEGYLKTAAKIFKHIIVSNKYNVRKYKKTAIDSLIFALSKSPSYKTSMIITSALIEAEKTVSLFQRQIKQLMKAIKSNRQVFKSDYACSDLKNFLLKKYGVNISS